MHKVTAKQGKGKSRDEEHRAEEGVTLHLQEVSNGFGYVLA